MAGKENLKPVRSKEEARERGSKGGKKSGEKRRELKTMREMLNYLLDKEITNNKGEKAITLEAIMVAQIKEALKGNTRAVQFIRDTIGQKPKDTVEAVNTNIDISDKKVIDTVMKNLKEL